MKLAFSVKKPKGATKSYSVRPYTRNPDGSKKYGEAVSDEALEALNRALKNGEIKPAQAELQFTHVIFPRLKKESKVQDRVLAEAQISEGNSDIFRKFWKREYSGRKLAMDGATARSEFIRALRVIEPLSLLTSTRDQLQKRINGELKEGGAHKKAGGRLNQLLSDVGRDFKLYTHSVEQPFVYYITWDEFLKARENVFVYADRTRRINEEDTKIIRALLTVLFSTGCRFGEIFPLRESDLKSDNSIFIAKQLKRDGTVGEVKNKKKHKALFLDSKEAREAFEVWTSCDKEKYRDKQAWVSFTRACKETFKSKDKHLSVHDLRHCYVIHLLGLGVPLDRIAKLIGDKASTCESSYAGFVSSDAEIDFVTDIIKEGKKRQASKKKFDSEG